MKPTITYHINRMGVFTTNKEAYNQCKDVGHTRYGYTIRVTVADQLDDDGFIIDHADIHTAGQRAFNKGISSCEMMCRDVALSVAKACKKNGCIVLKIYVQIKPEGSDVFAFMETELNYTQTVLREVSPA